MVQFKRTSPTSFVISEGVYKVEASYNPEANNHLGKLWLTFNDPSGISVVKREITGMASTPLDEFYVVSHAFDLLNTMLSRAAS